MPGPDQEVICGRWRLSWPVIALVQCTMTGCGLYQLILPIAVRQYVGLLKKKASNGLLSYFIILLFIIGGSFT